MEQKMENKFRYKSLEKSELDECLEKHKKIIELFVVKNGYDNNKIYVDETLIMSIIAKVHQRKKYFEYFHGINMSECKEVALTCFWYIKLHPICACSEQISLDDADALDCINEKLALYYILVTLKGRMQDEKISTKQIEEVPEKYLQELLYSFKYRDLSKEAIILLVETMAIFLGINPYSEVAENAKQE